MKINSWYDFIEMENTILKKWRLKYGLNKEDLQLPNTALGDDYNVQCYLGEL